MTNICNGFLITKIINTNTYIFFEKIAEASHQDQERQVHALLPVPRQLPQRHRLVDLRPHQVRPLRLGTTSDQRMPRVKNIIFF